MENFSSFPPEEEQHFIVFEERMKNAEKTATRVGIAAGVGVGALLLTIVFAYWGQVTKLEQPPAETTAAPASAPAPPAPTPPPPSEAPAAEAPSQ